LSCSSLHLPPPIPAWCEEHSRCTNKCQMKEWMVMIGIGRQCPLFCPESINFHFTCLASKYVLVACHMPGAVQGAETNSALPTQSVHSSEKDSSWQGTMRVVRRKMWSVLSGVPSCIQGLGKAWEEMRFNLRPKGSQWII
jgi:hypothetical protein